MSTIPRYLLARQIRFAEHPFFEQLERMERGRIAPAFVPALAFWLNAFGDALALNEVRIREPQLRDAARLYRLELSQRERQLAKGLATLQGTGVPVESLFTREHEVTRYAVYALVAETFRTESSFQRILLLLVLKSAGETIIERLTRFLGLAGLGVSNEPPANEDAESAVAPPVPRGRLGAYLTFLDITDEEHDEAIQTIGRAYDALVALFHALKRCANR